MGQRGRILAEGGGLGLGGGEAEAGGGVGIHRTGIHEVVVDAGVVTGHVGGQRLNKGPVVPRAGPQVEGGDVGVAAYRLCDKVGQHAGVPVAEDALGDAHPANGGTG